MSRMIPERRCGDDSEHLSHEWDDGEEHVWCPGSETLGQTVQIATATAVLGLVSFVAQIVTVVLLFLIWLKL